MVTVVERIGARQSGRYAANERGQSEEKNRRDKEIQRGLNRKRPGFAKTRAVVMIQ